MGFRRGAKSMISQGILKMMEFEEPVEKLGGGRGI